MEAVIFVGAQGAGKSTFYSERFFDTHVRISLDVLKTRRREQLIFEACLPQPNHSLSTTRILLQSTAPATWGRHVLRGFACWPISSQLRFAKP